MIETDNRAPWWGIVLPYLAIFAAAVVVWRVDSVAAASFVGGLATLMVTLGLAGAGAFRGRPAPQYRDGPLYTLPGMAVVAATVALVDGIRSVSQDVDARGLVESLGGLSVLVFALVVLRRSRNSSAR
jgi:hypothetical protein